MSFLVERLAELKRHLEHLRKLAPKVTAKQDLMRDLSLHNDVLFSAARPTHWQCLGQVPYAEANALQERIRWRHRLLWFT